MHLTMSFRSFHATSDAKSWPPWYRSRVVAGQLRLRQTRSGDPCDAIMKLYAIYNNLYSDVDCRSYNCRCGKLSMITNDYSILLPSDSSLASPKLMPSGELVESAEDQSDEVTEHIMWILDHPILQENSGRAGQTQDHSIYFPFFFCFPTFQLFSSILTQLSWNTPGFLAALVWTLIFLGVSEHILTK